MRIIKLTCKNGDPVYVNPNAIAFIEPDDNGSVIFFSACNSSRCMHLKVRESIDRLTFKFFVVVE